MTTSRNPLAWGNSWPDYVPCCAVLGPRSSRCLQAGALTIDLVRHVVTRGGVEIHLTPTEYDLLRVLAKDADKVLTHRQLLERVWGSYAAENAQQLRVYITYLRRKLEDDPTHPQLIVTEPGVGYRLKADPAMATDAPF
jgi:two-component system, OmpR family, KDP operon response regulator KdpE